MDTERRMFFEVFDGLERLGPGSRAGTLRALDAVADLPPRPRLLDAGCGRGAQTRVLAEALPSARIVPVDDHLPFLLELARGGREGAPGQRPVPCAADLAHLPFREEAFDLIWAEGSIYVVGLERGLKLWRPLVRPGGWIAVTEVAWLTAHPPSEAAGFWKDEYPGMGTLEEGVAAFRRAGLAVAERQPLETAAWEAYYGPLARRVAGLRRDHPGDPAADRVASVLEREIDVYSRFGDTFGYVFYVARRPA